MSKVRKVAYLPEQVASDLERFSKNYSSESAYINEAVRQLNAKERKANEQCN